MGGVSYVIGVIFQGLVAIVGGIFGGFIDSVVKPFLGIFQGAFSGLGSGLNEAFSAPFSGTRNAFESAYAALVGSFRFVGPAAPILAAVVVMGVVVVIVLVGNWLFRVALKDTEREVHDAVEGSEDE